MFLLDTNVLSAMMAADPAPSVAAWLSARPATSLFTTSISQAEILSGLAILPNGRRRTVLEAVSVRLSACHA
jgi:predicted nucleic acid-binding protein